MPLTRSTGAPTHVPTKPTIVIFRPPLFLLFHGHVIAGSFLYYYYFIILIYFNVDFGATFIFLVEIMYGALHYLGNHISIFALIPQPCI